ncbi:MAG: 3-keto-disaccharide hydrolase [Armatimonadota bacterium]
MRRILLVLAVSAAALALSQWALAAGLTAEERRQGFVPLFNGRDLSGWVVPDKTWFVENGAIVCSGKPGGWLRSAKQYANFILRGEYKISPNGNSGVFVRAPILGRASRIGMEMQILDDYGKAPNKNSTGAIYDVVAPTKNMSKPAGQWNSFEIVCDGRRVKITLNGEKVVDVSLDDPAINERLPETHKLYKRLRRGYIGLQNHGSRVEFRNLRVRELG